MSSKSTDRLQSGSRIPVRGLSSLFKQLDPGSQNLLRDAFVDAEDFVGINNITVPERRTRRKITGRIQTIRLEAESNLLGAFLKWNRVNDKKVSQYEIQTSNNNVFSDPDTFPSLENFFVLENIRAVVFARVRAVTFNGDTGLWSNIVKVRPKISAPEAYSISFYQGYLDSDSDPRLARQFLYSGGNAKTHSAFYTVISDTFYADKETGGLSIWGYLSSRLKNFRDSERIPWDRIRFKVNGITRTDAYIPFWVINYDDDNFHDGQRDPNENLMSFYSKAGYTASFGPYAVTLPNTIEGFGPNDPYSVYNRQASDGLFYWNDANNAARWSRFDEAQLTDIDDDEPHHEANALSVIENAKTDYLIFRDFKFNIPNDRVVVGIEAKIKHRQNNEYKNPIPLDKGKALINMPFTTITGLSNPDILEDSNGRFLFFNSATDVLETSSLNIGLTEGGGFTITAWLNNSRLVLPGGATNRESIFEMASDDSSIFASGNHLAIRRNSGVASDELRIDFKRTGDNIEIFNITNYFNTANTWIHLTVRWNGTNQLSIFKNGASFSTQTTSGGSFKTADRVFQVQIGDVFGLSDQCFRGGISQVALFNKALTDAEIEDIARSTGNFKIDLRNNFGDYQSADKLLHYWLFLPDQADIRDSRVHLIDEIDTIRTDLDNKAITDESWPRLSTFFYTDLRQFGILPLGLSNGIPHDNHSAIGYEVYGGEDDLWGGAWTPEQINNFYFGLALQAQNIPLNGFAGNAYVDHAKLTVYTTPLSDRSVNVQLEVAAASDFYLPREIYGSLCNIISLGQRDADDVDDC